MSEIRTEKQAADLRSKAKDQAEAATRSALLLAETLFDIKYSVVRLGGKEIPLVQAWKHDDFHEYCEHELGMHGSTGENYVHVHDVLVLGEGIDRASLPPSITKLIQLARVAKKAGQNTESWVKKAVKMSCCEFQAAVEETLTGKPVARNYAFWMSNGDIRTVERGLKRAKEILGTKHNGETVAQIVDEWCKLAEGNKLRAVRKAG